MTMMQRTPQFNDRELDFAGAIYDLHRTYMVSHRMWTRFDTSYGLHFHQFYEILIHKCNGYRMLVGADTYDMTPCTFYIIPPRQLHTLVFREPLDHYERICIYVTEAALRRAGNEIAPILDILTSDRTTCKVWYALTPAEYDELEMLADRMHRKVESDTLDALEEAEDMADFTRILCVLCRAVLGQRPAESGEGSHPLVEPVVRYINDHCREPLTLEDVAAAFGISKYSLSHLFTQAMGTSLHQYLLVCRIEAAKRMLLTGESITNVAYKCGFNDYSGFLRAFGKIMGCSPTVFKARLEKMSE